MPTDIKQLWADYKQSGAIAHRNALMEHYLPVARYHAERMRVKLPKEVETDDVMSVAVLGLMDAIKSFDPDRGVKFETYSAARIRGAIVDELRLMDWVPRLARTRAQKIERAVQAIEQKLDRPASTDDLAAQLQIDVHALSLMLKDAAVPAMVSLSSVMEYRHGFDSRAVHQIDCIIDRDAPSPRRHAEDREAVSRLLSGFSRAEKLIVLLYYFDGATMREVGKALDLSESRVSQMHSSVMARLKSAALDARKQMLDCLGGAWMKADEAFAAA